MLLNSFIAGAISLEERNENVELNWLVIREYLLQNCLTLASHSDIQTHGDKVTLIDGMQRSTVYV